MVPGFRDGSSGYKFIRGYLLEVAGKKSDVIMSSILFEKAMNLRMERWPGSVGLRHAQGTAR